MSLLYDYKIVGLNKATKIPAIKDNDFHVLLTPTSVKDLYLSEPTKNNTLCFIALDVFDAKEAKAMVKEHFMLDLDKLLNSYGIDESQLIRILGVK